MVLYTPGKGVSSFYQHVTEIAMNIYGGEMKTNLETIKSGFAFMDKPYAQRVVQDNDNSYWIFRWEDRFGVGITVPKTLVFSEVFATAQLYTDTIYLKSEGSERRFLLLTSSDDYSRNEFAKVCESFIELGEENQQRNKLTENPAVWWKTWRSLLGNAIHERMPYDVIGELFVYYKLLKSGCKNIVWNGPKKSSHDIESKIIDYEVKSTLKRYDSSVTISGQHQLSVPLGKKLFLVFCRFEPSETKGYSINSLINKIEELGVKRNDLEKKLSSLGFEEGRTSRLECYIIHGSVRLFLVDAMFPQITDESFLNGVLPAGIIRISYEVDLENLNSISLEEQIKTSLATENPI